MGDAAAKLEQVTALLAGMAHELRNVLATADTSLFLCSKATDEAARRDHLETARHQVRLAQDLVTRSLTPTAADPVAREPVALEPLLALAISSARQGGAHVELSLEGAPSTALVDPLLLSRALVNLIENAAQAGARAGRAEVSIRVAARSEGDGLVIEVTDDGPGFPQALRGHLFEALATGHAAGTGLGLRLVRTIAELHGGHVEASDREGGGACVRIWLPGS